jgi:hypothetical protein
VIANIILPWLGNKTQTEETGTGWGRSKHSDCSFFDHGYLEEEKSMIHSFTVTFGAKYLTGMEILIYANPC